jgi:4-aminobutyrate aminotransferase-like enzyme
MLFRDLGRKLARLDLALEGFSHPLATRSHRWDLARADQHQAHIPLIQDWARRRILERVFLMWRALVQPRLEDVPWSFIHGDANDENVLTEGDRVVGLLDFGDCLRNPTVCELAIAIAYVTLGAREPLEMGTEVVAGYHDARPLSPVELSILYPLVCARLAVSAVVAAQRRQQHPDHPTRFATEDRVWLLLERLSHVSPANGHRILASRIGVDLPSDEGAEPAELLERRRRRLGPSLSVAYSRPLKIDRGEGQYLLDHTGRPFLDLVNNVCHVGHCHPRVVAAGQRQLARLNTNTRYLYDGLMDYADRLVATLPPPLRICYLVNSGSEANELALRLARAHTGRRDFVVVDGAYHGHTHALVALSPYKFRGPGGAGHPEPWVHVAPSPDGYRGPHRGRGREVGMAYGQEVGQTLAECSDGPAGFLIESLISCGGQIDPPPGYLETAFECVRAAGGVCIADEVQVGFGRVGTHFWGFERQGVVPDIVVMGKPIGNGHPLSAVVTTEDIARSFSGGMEFFSTFGGNPVSCAIGMAVLDVIEREELQDHAREVGSRIQDGFRGLADRHPIIGDVRGAGLFIGVELVRDRETLEPATEEAARLIDGLRNHGVLLSTDGPFHNVLKIKPPMVLTNDDVDMLIRLVDDELSSRGEL